MSETIAFLDGAGRNEVDVSTRDPLPVTQSAPDYETVAASQATQAMGIGAAPGTVGDMLTGVLIVPTAPNPGQVSIKDGTSGSAIVIFQGGITSVQNLVPFFVSLGIRSVNGFWQITTGANVTAIGVGNFT